MKERSGAVGHRTSGSNASWELPTVRTALESFYLSTRRSNHSCLHLWCRLRQILRWIRGGKATCFSTVVGSVVSNLLYYFLYSTTSTYPGYHTRARQAAGAHYFADPLPMPPHIQPQPPQPLFYTSSSSSNDFLETQRTHRHGSGSGSGSVFHDGNSHSSSVSSDYLHRQGMMDPSVNSSDSTVYTGWECECFCF